MEIEKRIREEEIEKMKEKLFEKEIELSRKEKMLQDVLDRNQSLQMKLTESKNLTEKLYEEVEELAVHNVIQKAKADEVLTEVLIDAEVHDVTQADRIAKEVQRKLILEYGEPPSWVDMLKTRIDRKPTKLFTPTKLASPITDDDNRKPKPKPPNREVWKKKKEAVDNKTTRVTDTIAFGDEVHKKPKRKTT